MIAAIFPGQGSQHVGMGRELYDEFASVRERFQEANDLLNEDLTTLVFQGPDAVLAHTQWSQPAIFTLSAAVADLLREAGICFHYMAGHSMGEYSALYAAGVLSFRQTLECLQERARAMAEVKNGGMVAVLCLSMEDIEETVRDSGVSGVECANDNAPGQVVLSGYQDSLEKVIPLLQARGARCVPLKVSGPFHTSLMHPAQSLLDAALEQVTFHPSHCPVVTNVSAQPQNHPLTFKEHLVLQLTRPVRWRETLLELDRLGVQHFVEIGPGKVLTGLVKKTLPHAQAKGSQDVQAIHELKAFCPVMTEIHVAVPL